MNRKIFSLVPLVLVLVACGGGSGDDPPVAATPMEVPASAGKSNAAFVSYLGGLPAQGAEMREPVGLDGFIPPTSDTEEPIPIGG